MRRTLALWGELFALSCRRIPAATAATLSVLLIGVAATTGVALSLRTAVNGVTTGDHDTAVLGAVCAACAYAATHALNKSARSLMIMSTEKIGLTDIHEGIHRDIATLEGLEHLERTDYLDRVTTVRTSAWGIVASMWSAIAIFTDVLQLVVLLLLLGTVSPWLLLLLPAAALPLWANARGQRLINAAETGTAEYHRVQRHLFKLGTRAATGKELRVAGAGEEIVRRQSAAYGKAVEGRYRARMRSAWLRAAGWTVFTLGFGGGLALVGHRTAQGLGTPGDLVLTITVAAALRQSVQQAVMRAGGAIDSMRLIGPYLWLREYAAEHRNRTAGTAPSPDALREGITLTDVSYVYPGTERRALDGISVTLPAGAVIAVVGEFGSGKTTLVKLLSKFYRPDEGRITVDGTDLATLDTDAWRARTSAAYQDFGRFHTVFAQTVGLGDLPYIDDRERIAEAVRAADAEGLAARLPEGLDTQLGRELGGVDLSEGQWQKTALARASMRRDPLLFVLDEPTASLDAPSEQAIFQRYMDRARTLATRTGAVTVIVSHRFSTVSGADLILVLDKGRLTEHGTHKELLALGGRYADLYGIQATAYAAP
ncbi:ABC transporter ATP-binding protein [Streptomyces sp. NPDC093984]|uniref:ABC transporter ATP-binding protein n=1 Tax=Streptomyces sp. NPDC093984 TaxID=3366052 RepID=UPI00380A04AF